MGLQAGTYPFPRAKVEAVQAPVQVKAAEAARRAAVCSDQGSMDRVLFSTQKGQAKNLTQKAGGN